MPLSSEKCLDLQFQKLELLLEVVVFNPTTSNENFQPVMKFSRLEVQRISMLLNSLSELGINSITSKGK